MLESTFSAERGVWIEQPNRGAERRASALEPHPDFLLIAPPPFGPDNQVDNTKARSRLIHAARGTIITTALILRCVPLEEVVQ
jgi:hypothetical protein